MKRGWIFLLLLLSFFLILLFVFAGKMKLFSIREDKVSIAAAANLRYVLEEIKDHYLKKNPDIHIQITYGSSAILTQQILNGASFDLFMSADTDFPNKVKQSGFASGEIKTYCYGKIAIWSLSLDVSKGINSILLPEVKKIAIANPVNAPYGENTVDALKNQKLYDKISTKIVWGENINQTAQFAFSGNAEIGFIALSLALAPEMKNKGHYYVLPEEICPPVEQAAVLIKNKDENKNAAEFLNYLTSSECEEIWKKYGYKLPDKK